MNKLHLAALAAALTAAPLALGSVPPIKDYCEDPATDWPFHVYHGTTSVVIGNAYDQPPPSEDPPQGPSPAPGQRNQARGSESTPPPPGDDRQVVDGVAFSALTVRDGNWSGDCNGDTVPSDYDGHLETGAGGGILTYTAPPYPWGSPGNCALETPHHDGTIRVEDAVLGFGVKFAVGAEDTCDIIIDRAVTCNGWCDPVAYLGAPGYSDGAYWVYVFAPGTTGTITAW